mgnify:CR=1 FL=1
MDHNSLSLDVEKYICEVMKISLPRLKKLFLITLFDYQLYDLNLQILIIIC